MKIYPHILLKEGDLILLPNGFIAQVICLVNGQLQVKCGCDVFTLPYGFYLKKKDGYEPILCLGKCFNS